MGLALVYFDVVAQSKVKLRQAYGAAELHELFVGRSTAFAGWAQHEALHRGARDAAMQVLAFSEGVFRQGQRELAEAVYRTAANRRCLLAQAPTGIGKTVGTLNPLLRAMPAQASTRLLT